MFPELRLLHEELNAFNRIRVKEQCVIIIAKIVSISHAIVIPSDRYPRVDAHCVACFVQHFE